MIIKERDTKTEEIKALKALLQHNLTGKQKFFLEREIKCIAKGEKGEKDSIYYIDFYYSENNNYAVIHDLRLELAGKVAQIDHLIIGRFFDFFVLETKNYSYGIKITEDAEFLAYNNKKYYAIPSPIEQNKRHIFLLGKIIKEKKIMPTRLGLNIIPKFHNYVLVSTNSNVIRPSKRKLDTDSVIKADMLQKTIRKKFDNAGNIEIFSSIGKMVSSDTLMEVAKKITELHKPIKINYHQKFKISQKERALSPKNETHTITKDINPTKFKPTGSIKKRNNLACPKCGSEMILRTAKKGKNVGNQFWGCSNFPKCRSLMAYEK